ncbi:hypothetical protein CKF54_03635, partial [Psittacicella hinzii]
MQKFPKLSFTNDKTPYTFALLDDVVTYRIRNKDLDLSSSGKYQAVSIKAIGNDNRVVEFKHYTDSPDDLLKHGDIVMVMYGYCGRSAIVTEDYKYVLNPRVGLLRVKDEKQIDPYYLQAYFQRHESRRFMYVISQGTAQMFMTYTNLKSLPVQFPKIEEQNKVGHLFKELDDLIETTTDSYKKYIMLRKALIQRMVKPADGIPLLGFPEFYQGEDKESQKWKKSKVVEIATFYNLFSRF